MRHNNQAVNEPRRFKRYYEVISGESRDDTGIRVRFTDKDAAKKAAKINQALCIGEWGTFVIVRLNFNESDEKGDFFREWRSFGGDAFYECRWYFRGNITGNRSYDDGLSFPALPTEPIDSQPRA